jgi:hypothetical protein
MGNLKNDAHLKWVSSLIFAIRFAIRLFVSYKSCHEMISILANVARHVDFMATSIKYLSMEAHFQEQDIFAVLNGSHKRFFFSTLFHFFFIFQG